MDSIPDLLQTSSVIGSAIEDTQTVSAKSLVSEFSDDDDDDDDSDRITMMMMMIWQVL